MKSSRTWFWLLSSCVALATSACVLEQEEDQEEEEEALSETATPLLNTNKHIGGDGFCLTTYYGSGENGTAAMMWNCGSDLYTGPWSVTPNGEIRFVLSGRCLNVPAPGSSNPYVDIQDCNGSANQKWTVGYRNGFFATIKGWGGQCLNREGAFAGAGVTLRPCNDTDSQLWNTVHWVRVANVRYPNECWGWIDYIPGNNGYSSNKFKLGTRSEFCTGDQYFRFENNGGPIHWYESDFCLEALTSTPWTTYVPNYAQVWAKKCTGAANQKWTWIDGALRTSNNRCITRMWRPDGTVELQATTCSGIDVQKWTAQP